LQKTQFRPKKTKSEMQVNPRAALSPS